MVVFSIFGIILESEKKNSTVWISSLFSLRKLLSGKSFKYG